MHVHVLLNIKYLVVPSPFGTIYQLLPQQLFHPKELALAVALLDRLLRRVASYTQLRPVGCELQLRPVVFGCHDGCVSRAWCGAAHGGVPTDVCVSD